MSKEQPLNETVAHFYIGKTKYEIDKLLDSDNGNYCSYDIFKVIKRVGVQHIATMEFGSGYLSETFLIEQAKKEVLDQKEKQDGK